MGKTISIVVFRAGYHPRLVRHRGRNEPLFRPQERTGGIPWTILHNRVSNGGGDGPGNHLKAKEKGQDTRLSLEDSGGPRGIRTPNPGIMSPLR